MRAPEAPPIEPRHRRAATTTAPRRGIGGRWLPVGVVMAVAMVCAGVYVVDQLTVPEQVAEPDLLSLIPPTPDVPPVLAAPAAVDSAPSPEPEATGAAEPTEEAGESEEPAATSPTRRRSTGTAPGGLPWRSGLVIGTQSEVDRWESYRGRSIDVVHGFTERGSWEGIESASWILSAWADSPHAIVISQPFWPEGSGGSLSECASGGYNANWARYGEALSAAGRTDAYTRLAWEFNGDWFEWSATDVGAWKQCYRQVVQSVRSTAPGARFEWNMNAHGSATSDGDAWKSYPGDDVVDVVGIDPYDHYPASPSAAAFDEQCTDSEGLCSVIDFARAHGKGVGVTEWGIINSGIGDNPVYVEKMYETFLAGADVMEYETYFNEDNFSTTLDQGSNPESSEVYRRLWGG
ncbi:glycosyl hydrolase [Pseudonocardia abyssalis]|nr:glycosyl hydrolase [Pseudonocardia abyssalis]